MAGVAALLSIGELTRLIVNHGVTAGYNQLGTLIGGILFCSTLAIAGVGMALHRRGGWMFGVLASLAAAAHGIVVRAGGSAAGIAYISGSIVMLVLVIKSLHWYRSDIAANGETPAPEL